MHRVCKEELMLKVLMDKRHLQHGAKHCRKVDSGRGIAFAIRSLTNVKDLQIKGVESCMNTIFPFF